MESVMNFMCDHDMETLIAEDAAEAALPPSIAAAPQVGHAVMNCSQRGHVSYPENEYPGLACRRSVQMLAGISRVWSIK